MELSEAKERLKALVDYCYNNKECWDNEFCSDCYIEVEDNKAFEVILNYMDNSISKEYHEMVTKEQYDIINDLKNRLDNSISKDKVRKIINNKCYVEVSDYLDTINGIEELLGEE